jgi:hypothetical protein
MPIKKKTEVKDLDAHNEVSSNDGSMLFDSKEKIEDDVFVQKESAKVEKEDMLPMSLVQRMVKEVEERLSNQFNKHIINNVKGGGVLGSPLFSRNIKNI